MEGLRVKLRAWRDDDLQMLTELRNDVQLQSLLLARVKGSDSDQTKNWLQRRNNGETSILLVIADKVSDLPIGYVQFIEIDNTNRHAKMGICLARDHQNRGLGQEAIQLSLNHVDSTLGLRKVFLEVRADNDIAIRCYEKIGFNKCGLYREHHRAAGQWYDVVLMEYFIGQ